MIRIMNRTPNGDPVWGELTHCASGIEILNKKVLTKSKTDQKKTPMQQTRFMEYMGDIHGNTAINNIILSIFDLRSEPGFKKTHP